MNNIFIKSFFLLILIYFVITVVVYFFQRKLLYHPFSPQITGKGLIHNFETINFKTSDNLELKGWFHLKNFNKKNNLKRFYIVSGNHRTSVFFALFPDQELPVSYESVKFAKPRELQGREKSNFLKVYDSKDAPSWASVRSGFLTPTEAQEIMEVYLNV